MPARYAIYFAPNPSSPLWRLGSQLLGYDAERQASLEPPPLPAGLHDLWRKACAAPAGYGFHATLKPPMRLRTGTEPSQLLAAVERFCAGEQPFGLPSLALSDLRGFLALVPSHSSPALEYFAGRCVAYFEPFRAPLTPDERARRKPETLEPRQRLALDTWGYPYVFKDFAFHMTLSGRLQPQEAAALAPLYRAALAPALDEPVLLDQLSVFRQAAPGQPFQLWRRVDLAG